MPTKQIATVIITHLVLDLSVFNIHSLLYMLFYVFLFFKNQLSLNETIYGII